MGQSDAILDVVDKLYATALHEQSWAPALGAMSELLGSVGVSFEVFDVKAKAPLVFDYNARMPLPDKLDYIEYYSPLSPRLNANLRTAPGSISYDHMILSDQEMDKNEFYADFMAPLDLRYFLSVQVLATPSHQGVFAAQRTKSQGHVGNDEINMMRRLAPHLQQAAKLRFRLAEARHQTGSAESSLALLSEGCVAVTETGEVMFANARAQNIFSAADGVTCLNKRITFHDKAANAHLQRRLYTMNADHSEGEDDGVHDFPAKRPSGGRPYVISVRRLPPATEFVPNLDRGAALIFIRDPDAFNRLDQRLIAESYGLSAAEIDIAAEIDNGLTVGAIARKRGVAVTTIRTQLYALMAKMQVKRQTELVQLLSRYRLPFV